MTHKIQEASQASLPTVLEWRRVSKFQKLAGPYSIEVVESKEGELLYLAKYLDHQLAEFSAENEDRKAQEYARDHSEAACVDHAIMLPLRTKAYAAVGGTRLAKVGHAVISMLTRDQLHAVIAEPDTIFNLADDIAGPSYKSTLRAPNTAGFG